MYYIKIAFRNILKHKGYSIINISGMAIGFALFSVLASIVDFAFNFDKFHQDANRIYSLIQILPLNNTEKHTANTPAILSRVLKSEFAELEDATRFIPTSGSIKYNGKEFYDDVTIVDSNFFTFFSFELIAGDPGTSLMIPNSAIITESIVKKYFGDENPMGKTLDFDGTRIMVKGIAKDPPPNSSLKFDILVAVSTFSWSNEWNIFGVTYFRLNKSNHPKQLERKFPEFIQRNISNLSRFQNGPKEFYLLPLVDQYLGSDNITSSWWSDLKFVYLCILAIGICLLLVVCFNFINLLTSQYLTRTGEIGIRKAAGATRQQLVLQFLSESIVLSQIAFLLSLVLFEILCPIFINFIAQPVLTSFTDLWHNPVLLVKLFGITIVVGVLAGSYPAFFLSGLKPVEVLKGKLKTSKKGTWIRQILVASQFVLSIFLLIFSIAWINQYEHLFKLDLGFNSENVMILRFDYDCRDKKFQPLKDKLLQHPDILAVASGAYMPFDWNNQKRAVPEGFNENKPWIINRYHIDPGFPELFEMEIVRGRSFSDAYTDKNSIIINETAAREFGWKNPIGKTLTIYNWSRKTINKKGTVIGVVKDFHFKSFYNEISPSVMYFNTFCPDFIFIKVSELGEASVTKYIEEQWNAFNSSFPFEWSTFEDKIVKRYHTIKKFGICVSIIGATAIFFSCLGLFGLTLYIVQGRTKEIGIRKTYGASIWNIFWILLVDFLKLVFLANAIAWPLVYFITKSFMDNLWAYPIEIGPWYFIGTGVLTTTLAFLAVVIQTYRAATANPIEALRCE